MEPLEPPEQTMEPPEPPPSPWLTGTVIAVAVVIVALLTALVILLIRDDATTEAGSTTSSAPTTSSPATTLPPTTTTAPPTTSTTAPTSTTTTTLATTTTSTSTTTTVPDPPFSGDTDPKNGPVQGAANQRVIDVRHAQRDGFTRVVFDFQPGGGIPGYYVAYSDPTHLAVLLFPIDTGDPFAPGIFTAGQYAVGTASVVAVFEGGMGAGSGEWQFDVQVAPNRPFSVGTLTDPPRLYVDVED